MTEDNRDAEPLESTVDRLYREEADAVRRGLERKERWRQSLRVFLHDVARRSGIYADHDGPAADWRFWHRTFREAVAAERLAEIHAADGEAEVLDRARAVAGHESRWAEPFALLTGHVDDPDALVRALLEANRDLGLRAIATAPRLDDDTLRQALAITDDREERAAVYRRIPELLGEGDRSLRLLDRLRRGTRDGEDLFFLHLAVEETARRFPTAERQAKALLARLFDHIEPPPAALFETITTCEGSGPLWRPIPAGRFLMGSPEGVGYDDERPRHEVEIPRPFRLGAVPVTNRHSGRRTHRVGGLPANDWKLHDLHGQVWVWTASPWRDDYQSEPAAPEADPAGDRVLRGGSWDSRADDCRSAYRHRDWPGDRLWNFGFRVRLPAPERD